jgi:uncharacterized protein YcfL
MKRLMFLALLFLAACGSSPQLTTTRQLVVLPEESMYTCQRFTAWPETSNLTSNQVSRLIVDMYQHTERCYNSQQTIRSFLEEAHRHTTAQ